MHVLADVAFPLPVELGIAGILLTLFMTGQLTPGFATRREQQRAEDAELRERDKAREVTSALLEATRAIGDAALSQRDMLEALRQLRDTQASLEREKGSLETEKAVLLAQLAALSASGQRPPPGFGIPPSSGSPPMSGGP